MTDLFWAVVQWHRQVANRPLANQHRRALDDVWRQVIRRFGGDPDNLLGPAHDDLLREKNAPSIPTSPTPTAGQAVAPVGQLAELSAKATPGEWCAHLMLETSVADSDFCDALVNAYRAGWLVLAHGAGTSRGDAIQAAIREHATHEPPKLDDAGRPIRLPCPVCSGAGFDTHEDRHARTRMDVCRECGGTGEIAANTGTSAETSAPPAAITPAGTKECPTCAGGDLELAHPCPQCRGAWTVPAETSAPPMMCVNCGSTQSLEEIQAAGAVSCCPERHMVPAQAGDPR